MKTQISSLELKYLVDELQSLKDGKVEQIYQLSNKEIIISIHVPNKGKSLLRINVPGFMYITKYKKDVPELPKGFCQLLRKHIKGARLRIIKQINSERIVEFYFQTKESNYLLITEFYLQGNIILCSEDYTIISPIQTQKWKDRTVKKGEKYIFPKKQANFFKITKSELSNLIKKSDKDNIATTLATDLGLGGTYAQEACNIASIDPDTENITQQQVENIHKALNTITSKKPVPNIVYKNKEVIDIIPFEISKYKDAKKKTLKSFNDALSQVIVKILKTEQRDKALGKFSKQIMQYENIIEKQTKQLKSFEKSIKENTEKAELIYQNYNLVKEVIEELNKASKTHTWKQIKEKLKNHKTIKQLNTKDKKVIIEV